MSSGLPDRIDQVLKEAMKEKDALRVSTVRMLKSALKNLEIDKKRSLEDAEIYTLIHTMIKQRREAADMYRKGERVALADKEEAEIEILFPFLPQQLSEEAVRKQVQACIEESGASSMKDLGVVMKLAMSKMKGQAEGKTINQAVRELLSADA